MAIAIDGVVCDCSYSGPHAILLALNNTKADIVLQGFDLTGGNSRGHPYADQFNAFVAVLEIAARDGMGDRIFRHSEMKGPLVELVSEWQ
jgi:hypothetical protein